MVEQSTENARVVGSSPTVATKDMKDILSVGDLVTVVSQTRDYLHMVGYTSHIQKLIDSKQICTITEVHNNDLNFVPPITWYVIDNNLGVDNYMIEPVFIL